MILDSSIEHLPIGRGTLMVAGSLPAQASTPIGPAPSRSAWTIGAQHPNARVSDLMRVTRSERA